MTEQELRFRCQELASVGDLQARATLALFAVVDRLRTLETMHFGRVVAVVPPATPEPVPAAPRPFDGNTPFGSTKAGYRTPPPPGTGEPK